MKRHLRRFFGTVAILVVLALLPTGWAMATAVPHIARGGAIETAPVAMVLGASVHDGQPSPFLAGRLDVAADLFERGKVKAILVSGDNADASYDEPTVMKDYLVSKGIPADQIVRDPAGFDTYDSCVRARDVFGVTRLVVVTQDYHLPRAVAVCRAVGLEAQGAGDRTARDFPQTWRRGLIREVAANWKAVWDIISQREPTQSPYDSSLDDAISNGR